MITVLFVLAMVVIAVMAIVAYAATVASGQCDDRVGYGEGDYADEDGDELP